jgi:hypothetical protein
MISFSLQCGNDHRFDSWFTSSGAYDSLQKAGHLACPICGDSTIEKALMAPAISAADTPAPISKKSEVEAAMAQMRRMVEENSDYVGMNFAAEARAMHLGDMPARPIYGEAKGEEARALIEDGIPVAPLPFLPRAKVN